MSYEEIMGEFIQSSYNFSLSALVILGGGGSDSGDINEGSGISSFLTLDSTATTTIEPFSTTTLLDYQSFNDTIGHHVVPRDGGNGGVSSLERGDNGMFSFGGENRTLMISDLPDEFSVVDETAWTRIYAYFAVFLVSAIANFCELVFVCRRLSTRPSPVNRLFLHLCIADLIVVFMVAAVEVMWRVSIGWYAGNIACKAVMFSRAFGLYLSSLMICCISLDRYYAVVYPLRVIDASQRVKMMLMSSWIIAAICAIPQSIVFRDETHPQFPMFHQCSTLWMPKIERANTWLSLTLMYFIPLGVIIFSYGSIIIKIAGHLGSENYASGSTTFLRRNGIPIFQRAKLRTLKLTFVIVVAFVLCWSPYILISTWYLIDEKSATNLDGNLQDALFIMAVANSMANPIVYGCNESCKKRKQQQDPCKDHEQRSDALIMRNYSCRCSHKTRVRFSCNNAPRSAV